MGGPGQGRHWNLQTEVEIFLLPHLEKKGLRKHQGRFDEMLLALDFETPDSEALFCDLPAL